MRERNQVVDPLDVARQVLESTFFRDDPNPWVNGIAIGSLPADGVETAPPREILVFIDPSTPDCERVAIERTVAAQKHQNKFFASAGSWALPLLVTGLATSLRSSTTSRKSAWERLALSLKTPGADRYILSSNHVLAHNGRVQRQHRSSAPACWTTREVAPWSASCRISSA